MAPGFPVPEWHWCTPESERVPGEWWHWHIPIIFSTAKQGWSRNWLSQSQASSQSSPLWGMLRTPIATRTGFAHAAITGVIVTRIGLARPAKPYGVRRIPTVPYEPLRSSTKPYGTLAKPDGGLWSPTTHYGALRSFAELYGGLRSCTTPYVALRSPRSSMELNGAVRTLTNRYQTVCSCTKPYRHLRSPM